MFQKTYSLHLLLLNSRKKTSKIQYEFTATQITRSNNHTLHTHARTLNTVTVDDDAYHDDKDLQKTQV